MRLPRAFTLALLAAVLFPGAACPGTRFAARDEPLRPVRALAGGAVVLPARRAPFRFDLVGLHWRGPGTVWFRTAPDGGRWSHWQPARPEAEDLPDPGTREARARAGWAIGNPYWTGPARRIQYRLSGRVARLRADFVWSPPAPGPPARRATIAGTPSVLPRSSWGADESIVRASPRYAGRVTFAIVHHTAGRSPSSPEESAAMVRAIEVYHVRGNGWNDIGYNFLVDRFGQIFEGRGGGVASNVVGAHAEGFNTGSVGVAVIGSYDSVPISGEARGALAALLAWRLDLAHVDPLGLVTWISGGNRRFPSGVPVTLRAISGHRDTGFTDCPGDALYGQIGEIATEVATIGLPKLYGPEVSGDVGAPVRFRARLSEALPWTVTVTDADGNAVASGSGAGSEIDWTWDASSSPAGSYGYRMEAGPAVLPAVGTIGGELTLAVTNLRASPRAITPNEDGVGDAAEISFFLTVPARVSAVLRDAAGNALATLVDEQPLAPGATTLSWNGATPDGTPVPDGRYRIAVTARSETEGVFRSVQVVVDRTLGAFAARPAIFSPNGDARLDVLELGFDLSRPAQVRVRIKDGDRPVASVFDGTMSGGGRQTLSWNGRKRLGRVRDGTYTAVVEATTDLGTRTLAQPFALDTQAPRISDVSARTARGATTLRFSLSEPARVVVWYDGAPFRLERGAGEGTFWRRVVARRVRMVAWDAAGNASETLSLRVPSARR